MSEYVYPLDGPEYTAAQAGAWHGTRTSGVWAGDGNLAVTVGSGWNLILSPGLAWFTTDQFWGKVYVNNASITFPLPNVDEALDTYCRVIIRWDKTANSATAMLLSSTPSSDPVPPERQMTNEVFDLVLADYIVVHGDTGASAERLTDQRLNEDLCGLMRDGVTRLPTQTLYDQYDAVLAELRSAIAQAWSGEISEGAVSEYYTGTIPTGWSGSGPYTKVATVAGIRSTDHPIVDLLPSDIYATAQEQIDAWGSIYKVVATADNTLTFYATDEPPVAIPIQVRCIRK